MHGVNLSPSNVLAARAQAARLPYHDRLVLRWAVAIFAAIVFEGAARKWLLPASLQAVPYFAKDVLAALFLVNYRPKRRLPLRNHLLPFVLGIALCLTPALLLGLVRFPIGALVVFKNAVLWPLFAIHFGSYLTEAVTDRLAKAAILFSVVIAGLGLLQYFGALDSPVNRYAWDTSGSADIATAGNFVRATGTFSYISGLASFSIAMFCLLLGRLPTAKGMDVWLLLCGLPASVVCGLVTGSRSVLVVLAFVAMLSVLLIYEQNKTRLIGGVAGAGLCLAVLWNSHVAEGVLARWASTQETEVRGRITGTSLGESPLKLVFDNPLGYGLGLNSGATAYFDPDLDIGKNENVQSRIAQEAGLPGVIAMGLGLALILRASLMTWRIKSKRASGMVPVAIGMLLQAWYGLWYDHTSSALWWWVAGIWLAALFASPWGRRAQFAPVRYPRTRLDMELGTR